ncbi:hypothetical protein P4B35_08625 [Pontiellaceae bacterium B12227]|nr:hypothetical protein [Pontiellaceae bacterium B12227]
MNQTEWVKIRKLLWDDDEHILIVDDVRQTKPMKLAGKITVQPKAQFCCGNSFRPSTSRRKDNVQQFHTWVIEFDDMPIEDQCKLWEQSDMPHTLRVFSGNKSIHVYIRPEKSVDAKQWQQIASDLKLIFPDADMRVLTDRCRLTRLPNGMRGNICQEVETIKSRVALKTLTEWIARQDVIKDKGIKAYSNKDIEKNNNDESLSGVGKSIRAMNRAKEMLQERYPQQYRLYHRLVEARFKAERGKRNERLIELITFLHDSVCMDVAMLFAEHFYKANAICFSDPIETHMKEAKSHWNNLESEYPNRLSASEREYYLAITNREKTFFRICRSLAHKEGSEDKFNIPMAHFGHRMNLDGQEVSRLINVFKVYELLKTVSKGSQHKQNKDGVLERGTAGTYCWLPGDSQMNDVI